MEPMFYFILLYNVSFRESKAANGVPPSWARRTPWWETRDVDAVLWDGAIPTSTWFKRLFGHEKSWDQTWDFVLPWSTVEIGHWLWKRTKVPCELCTCWWTNTYIPPPQDVQFEAGSLFYQRRTWELLRIDETKSRNQKDTNGNSSKWTQSW